jgi:hypothetical protein
MSQLRLKNKRRSRVGRDSDWDLDSVVEAAGGLYGMPLGLGQFLRKLPGRVLRIALDQEAGTPALLLITGHALLIVNGDLNQGLPQSLVLQSSGVIHQLLVAEHLRRLGMLRARYPSDPLREPAELFWWTGHPLLKLVLHKMPATHGEKLKELILKSGDVTLVNGHVALLPAEEQQKLAEAFEEFDRHLPELLAWVEEQYGDADSLAWTATPVLQ